MLGTVGSGYSDPGAYIPPKPMMHIAVSPSFHKMYKFPIYFHLIDVSLLNLRVLLLPILAVMHHTYWTGQWTPLSGSTTFDNYEPPTCV